MTLHEAIEKLLQQTGHAMTAREIADELNKSKWYIKGDKSQIEGNQITARVNNYQNLFDIDRSVSPLQIKLKQIPKPVSTEPKFSMDKQFVNCPKCDTRNFADDGLCGICGTKLPIQKHPIIDADKTTVENQQKNAGKEWNPSAVHKKTQEKSINYKALMIIVGVVVFIYFAFIKEKKYDNAPHSPSFSHNSYGTSKGFTNEISKSDVEKYPELQLAIINSGNQNPTDASVNIFRYLLGSIESMYPNRSAQDIANALVSAHNIIQQYGINESLLQFTTAFEAYCKEINGSFNMNMEEALALFVKIAYSI